MVTSTMPIQNKSIEGAYDEAIEDAASRIYEASRPQRAIASNSSDNNNTSLNRCSAEIVSNVEVIVADEKTGMTLSQPSSYTGNNSNDIYDLMGDNDIIPRVCDNNIMFDDDIVSNIHFLEEKKQILKKVKVQNEKEKAYVAANAHDISNRREHDSHRTRPSAIWTDARKIVEKFKLSRERGSRSEEDEGYSHDSISSTVGDVERPESTPSHSESEICSPLMPSLPEYYEYNASSTRKRTRIDLSTVKQVSSTQFAKESLAKEGDLATSGDEHDDECHTEKKIAQQNHILNATRWQQVREMLLATDSRNWISEAALEQIFVLSSTAISEYQRSILATGDGQ